MDPRIRVSYVFHNLQDATKESIRELVERQLANKLGSYIQGVLGDHEDAILYVNVSLKKNSRDTYDGNVTFDAPRVENDYRYDAKDFNKLPDLVTHAFDHYKTFLADKR